MGVKGRRKHTDLTDEPTLLGDIDDIIRKAESDGFIKDCYVDIESIIKQRNIVIRQEVLPSNKSGYLAKIDGIWTIGVNKLHHIRRQRFTLAHEFAHFCLHKFENNFFEDEILFRDNIQTSIEYAANEFGAKLLMPENLIKNEIAKGTTSLNNLAIKFGVSILAVKYRVLGLGYNVTNDDE